MNGDVHFKKIRLIPIGQEFISQEEMAALPEVSDCKEIEHARKQFKQMVLGKEDGTVERKSRDEQQFVNKTQFILQREHETCWEHLLIDLLADQTTLFSRDYQLYATDHPAYLGLRRQQGNTVQTQLQLCLDEALAKAPCEEKERYEKILRRIAQEAARASKPLTEVEQEMINGVIGRKVSAQEVKDFFQWVKENTDTELVLSMKNELFPKWELSRQEREYLVQSYFREDGTAQDRVADFYQRFLTYHIQEYTSRVIAWLKCWIPDLELHEEDAQPFVGGVLEAFFYRIRILPLEKAAAGHHSAQYRVCDKTAFLVYQKRKEYLRKALKQYQEWTAKEDRVNISELPDPIVDLMGTSSKNLQINVPTEEVVTATSKYLSSTRGGVKHFDKELAAEVVSQTAAAVGEKINWFPMLYLIICVAGSSQLFSTSRSLRKKAVQDVFKTPYHQKPTESEQRIHRIRFLHKLHRLCKLDRNQRSVSWENFLEVHGSKIQSSEEADLWHKVIWGNKRDLDHPREVIPPIELSLLCNECLRTCLPSQPERLYGYRGGSTLHLGGFDRFLREHPNVLSDCVQRIKQRPERWRDIQKQYLKQSSMISCDLLEIKEQCRQGCALIRWGTIPKASQEELSDFCRSLYEGNVDKKQIVSDTEELKMLLVETALREVLADSARDVLAAKTEEAWMQSTGTQIRISFDDLKK